MSRVCTILTYFRQRYFYVSLVLVLLCFSLIFWGLPFKVLAAGNTTGYAWSLEGGWIDFNPTGGGVTVSDTKLTGYAWGVEAGWINFDCAVTPGECPDNAQKVTNDGSGNLSGYAWIAEVGWLNFNCQTQGGCLSGSQKVVINGTTGNFSGYAWGDEIGWVSFETAEGANVNTSWRTPIPDFSISAAPNNITAYPTDTKTSTITITSLNGFNQNVDLTATPSHACLTIGFSQNPVVGGSGTSTLTINTTNCAVGNHTITVQGDGPGGSPSHQTTITVQVGVTLTVGNTSGWAWSENAGWISLNCDHTSLGLPLGDDTCASQEYGVLTTDDALYGYAWGENVGWISLNCNEVPIGGTNHCLTGGDGQVDYGVTNDNGVLGGYAWGEQIGWISFNPVGDEGVVIDPATGVFSNYAWGENIGWVSFSDGATYQGETTWRGILGLLATPTNLHHISNTETSITWQWDSVANATGYEVYLQEADSNFYPVCVASGTTTCMVANHHADFGGGALSANTEYTVRVKARDTDGNPPNYTDSELSNPDSAYTSAAVPINVQAAGSAETSIDWSWSSGGAESGFYARIKEDPAINSGWLPKTTFTWTSPGLTCGTAYTLQVKAKNADYDTCTSDCIGDETGWAESLAVATADCPASCTDAQSCSPGEICVGGACRPADECIPEGAVCTKIVNEELRDGFCTAEALCNTRPKAAIVETQTGTLDNPYKFTGGGSNDDYTSVFDLKARWDFAYDLVTPTWDIVYNGIRAATEVSYQYLIEGNYTVALQVQDGGGLDSAIATWNISVAGPQIAINPIAYPVIQPDYNYNFGIIQPTETKDINMLVCNLGGSDLVISSTSFAGDGAAYFSTNAPVSFTLKADPSGPTVCNPDVKDQSRRSLTLICNPAGTADVFIATYTIFNNDEDLVINLRCIAQESPLGETAAENIIYDGRIMANSPPGFVEFIEVQVSQKERPR